MFLRVFDARAMPFSMASWKDSVDEEMISEVLAIDMRLLLSGRGLGARAGRVAGEPVSLQHRGRGGEAVAAGHPAAWPGLAATRSRGSGGGTTGLP
jgi:hypothetical protein